ncbi:sensor histidine kinase [Flavobacterium psychrotrophum]|uniref:sensor histidine kinase n=1 Tax=Flavobacterium psychrotrophum TaxID=2294119 RepID=UPI000E310754|nr:HAMP domain-containing sensor histidine kinase [Flavobacterium psychrotrophum]
MAVKRNILFVFILMLISVSGITALQFYYSYTNYKVESATFQKEIDEAFAEAVDSAFSKHQQEAVNLFRTWINDTTYIKITSRWDAVNKATVFDLKEMQRAKGNNQVSLSIDTYKKQTDSITAAARSTIINHLVGNVEKDLKKGVVWYFTQGLGDRLDTAYFGRPIPRKVFTEEYKKALGRKFITTQFKILEADKYTSKGEYVTVTIDVGLKHGMGPKLLAQFSNGDAFLLGRLRWVIAGSVMLLIITLGCFLYTARVLLSQQKLNALKDDFISNMTHEIHTPLTSITITAQALKQFNHDKAAQDNYLDIILYQSDKLSLLADEILAGAKLDVDAAITDTIDVNRILSEVAQSHFAESVTLNVEPLSNDIAIRGNKLNLLRALNNLIDNAIKYNTNVNPCVTIGAGTANKKLVITISDNGPGIHDELKEIVFEPFYRIPSGNVHDVKGYGLGLSYVKKVVTAHKGCISIKDNVPTGSCFIITLPL